MASLETALLRRSLIEDIYTEMNLNIRCNHNFRGEDIKPIRKVCKEYGYERVDHILTILGYTE